MTIARRTVLAGAAGVGLAACATVPAASKARAQTFVLVHGAWHGGWCWRDVRATLEAKGATVFTPTLTGLGERAHLKQPVPSLATHIDDVVGLIEAEELSSIVLVGHSYGGMVITGVADRLKTRLAHVVYLDAAIPEDGQSFITQKPDLKPGEADATLAGLKALAPDGVWMAPPPIGVLGVPESNQAAVAWLKRRLTPHPLRTWTDPIRLANSGAVGVGRTFVFCTAPMLAQSSFPAHAARIRAGGAGPGWRYRELETGHDAMVTAPTQTAALIWEAATAV